MPLFLLLLDIDFHFLCRLVQNSSWSAIYCIFSLPIKVLKYKHFFRFTNFHQWRKAA